MGSRLSSSGALGPPLHTSGGFVGIGPSTPGYPLDVQVSNPTHDMARLQNTDPSGFSTAIFGDSAGTEQLALGYGNSGVGWASAAALAFLTTATAKDFAVFTNFNEVLRLTAARHLVASSGVPTVAAAVGAGTTPPAPSVSGNDIRGTVSWGTGTSPAAGAQVTLTFAAAYAGVPQVLLVPANAATAALAPYVTAVGTASVGVALGTAPAASQAAATYSVGFVVIG